MTTPATAVGAGRREPPLLEQWYRDHRSPRVLDLSSSGVPALTVAEALELVGLGWEDLGAVRLDDSESLGALPLRQAVAQAWGIGDPDRVLATQGSNESIFLVMHTLLAPGDEVVSVSPVYHAYQTALQALHCDVRWWRLPAEAGFQPDLDRLDALVRPTTKAIIVNFPHNPTGVSVSPAEQATIIDISQRAGAYLLWDNAFAELTYDSPPLTDPTRLYDRALSIGTLSKAYGLPGLRIGWCLGPPELLARTIPLRDSTTLFLSPLTEAIATAAVGRRAALRERYACQLAGNRRRLLEWAAASPDVADCPAPAGGVTAFVRFAGIASTIGPCRDLARAGVLLLPGAAFGHPDRVRLGFGGPAADLLTGLGKVTEFLAA